MAGAPETVKQSKRSTKTTERVGPSTEPTTAPLEASERRGAERSEGPRSGEASNGERPIPTPTPAPVSASARPDPEVPERPSRRHFTAEFKLKVLQEADACRAPGQIGELLRRHGLYTSHLSLWRRERDLAARAGLDRKRGPGRNVIHPLARRVAELEAEIKGLRQHLQQATTIIEVQKKVSEIFGVTLDSRQSNGNA